MMRAVLCSLIILCILAPPAETQYRVLHGTTASGGGVAGGSHIVYCTAAQPVIGVTYGAGNAAKAGFWYCAGISSTVDVAITSLFAELRDDAVLLSWTAGSNGGFEGFNVYRSPGAEIRFERINPEPIPPSKSAVYRDETAEPGESYRYRIGAASGTNEWYSVEVSVTLPPKPLSLHQNFPNPFNPTTTIAYYLPRRTQVRLAIFDVRGALVRELVNRAQEAGRHAAPWNGTNGAGARVASGVYYYRLEADKQVITKKLVIVR